MASILGKYDSEIANLLKDEETRQKGSIRLIPSENYVSKAVMEATGSYLTNKYSEGYPGKRYYEGQEVTDVVETLARERTKKVFGAEHVNVQPYSGSGANLGTYLALAEPGDTIMGMSLPDGGHLTHGWKVSATGKLFHSVQYNVNAETGRFDYERIADLAKEINPKIIICGASAYPREINFELFGQIAKDVGAYLVSDIAHIAGLVAGGVHMSPVPYSDVVTTTTHKTLRGPRGGLIMCREEHGKAIDKAIFPGLQGGPHMHTISGIAVAMSEAASDGFKSYAEQIVKNAKAMAEQLMVHGFNLVSGGTDNHLILIDLRSKEMPGKKLSKALNAAHIVTNCNSIPNDPAPPFNPSGLRLGTPAITTLGMKEEQSRQIADFINKVTENVENESEIEKIGKEVRALCNSFPLKDYFVG
ncbi:MAG: serine hydroxymethyltransferase [Planctomycetota bacterium]|jgi:glycine hydroxymethyltransferase